MKKYSLLVFVILISIIAFVYKSWFLTQALVGGDWGYIHSLQFSSFALFPPAWETMFNLGYVNTPFIWAGILLNLYINSFGKFLSFNYISLFGFFIPFLLIGIYSIRRLMRELNLQNNWAILLGTMIYMTNTYILMVLGGGQILVGLSYAIAPFVFALFMQLMHQMESLITQKANTIKYIEICKLVIYAGLVFSVQILFDLRIAYVTIIGLVIYFVYRQIFVGLSKALIKNVLFGIIFVFLIPAFITLMLHLSWIMPVILGRTNPINQLGTQFSSLNAVNFFSFAKFENTIALLHPNWPENIFGKVYFMKPEFLLLPIIAFSSLLFLKGEEKKKKLSIIFSSLLALVSAFLAKGANEPFGQIYLWMFNHIPGFVMFRDPTKWYVLIAISYSILIPFAVWQMYTWLKSFKKFSINNAIINLHNLFVITIVLSLMLLIKPVVVGNLSGTFAIHNLDKSYIQLAQMLDGDKQFSRTLWIPSVQRFGFYSDNHPAISGKDFFNVTSLQDLVKPLKLEASKTLLRESSIGYIIVPFDSDKEIFVKNRVYSENEYQYAVKALDNISWIKKYKTIGKTRIYTLDLAKDHFWIDGLSKPLVYRAISPSEYDLSVQVKTPTVLVFSESYNGQWILKNGNQEIPSQPFHKLFNSFSLSGSNKNIKVFFKPQEWVNYSLLISLVSLILIIAVLITLNAMEKSTRSHEEA